VTGKSKVPPHVFQADPDVPGCCARCHLPGQPGDAHHTMPPPVADVRQRAAGDREADR
jgi:hypothetical protein